MVYKLTHGQNGWTESVLYSFDLNGSSGGAPLSEVTLGDNGRIYGTLYFPGYQGLVYELVPGESGYTEVFADERCAKDTDKTTAGVVFDSSGDLFFSSQEGGANGGGTAFELSPDGATFECMELYNFYQAGPFDTVTLDSTGNVYGAEQYGGTGNGDVFELTKNSYYEYGILHYFEGPDGYLPKSGLVRAPDGTLYGETFQGGTDGWGVVFQVTP